jgi:hypothetical protein
MLRASLRYSMMEDSHPHDIWCFWCTSTFAIQYCSIVDTIFQEAGCKIQSTWPRTLTNITNRICHQKPFEGKTRSIASDPMFPKPATKNHLLPCCSVKTKIIPRETCKRQQVEMTAKGPALAKVFTVPLLGYLQFTWLSNSTLSLGSRAGDGKRTPVRHSTLHSTGNLEEKKSCRGWSYFSIRSAL